jgi:hypothetical protein
VAGIGVPVFVLKLIGLHQAGRSGVEQWSDDRVAVGFIVCDEFLERLLKEVSH